MKTGDVVGGKYRIIRVLGEGAMGSVWEALNERTSRRVALKLILKPSEELRRRLLREAHACGGLLHPNIVELYDVGETDIGDPFLVMQLLQGETLAATLHHHRRLVPRVAAHIARDIASALAAAHEARVIHRDLKPANVFMHRTAGNEEGVIVKVVDFGLSRLLDACDTMKTQPGTIVGSPAYMSPEQFMMIEDIDHRTDIWSLGVCLFEMLAGVRPFQGKTYQDIYDQVIKTNAPLVTSRVRFVDERLAAIVARCLKRDRAMRIGSATELAAMLDAFANARADAPIVLASQAKEITTTGTVIIASEPLPRVSAPELRAPVMDVVVRQAPWREKPLDDILTETEAVLSMTGASTEAGVTTSLGGPMVPVANKLESNAAPPEPRKIVPENGRPKRHLVVMAAAAIIGIVCVTSVVVANRAMSGSEAAVPTPPSTNLIAAMTTAGLAPTPPLTPPLTAPTPPLTAPTPTPLTTNAPADPKPMVTGQTPQSGSPKKDAVTKPPDRLPTVKTPVKVAIVPSGKPKPHGTGPKPRNPKPFIPF